MPRYPDVAPSIAAMPGSPFAAISHKIAAVVGERFPLHIGDTWMEPPAGCRMEDFKVADHPGMHKYAPVQGIAPLLDRIVERERSRTGVPTERGNVLVSAGATGGLGAVIGAIVDPGEEVILVAPYWPLFSGIVRSFHGVPVPAPLVGDSRDPGFIADPDRALALLDELRTERTVALYLNTPNNPTGRVIPRAAIEALVGWAQRHGLWVIADEVYEQYVYEGEHVYARSLAPERTFAAYSFSKAYGMAGNRCGYVIAPADHLDVVRKISTHTFYSTPTASQLAAAAALDGPGDAWVDEARAVYRDLGGRAAARLGLPAPQGSTFLFFDISAHLDDGGLLGFLEDCLEEGIFVAPGTSFGPYPTHIRVCFTSAAPDVIERGVDKLARRLGL